MASNKILTDLEVKGKLTISDVSNASSDPDKFLSINGSQLVQYRTGSQLRGDIGAGTGSGTVTSVGLTIDEDQAISISNTPITSSGNIGLNFEGDAAQVILGSGELGTYFTGTTTPSNTQTFTNKSGNISQWTNDSGYITSSSIPSVGNGTLTMTTSTGLDGGATFTANQSGNSSFAVTLDLTEITLGVGLDATATGLSLDLSEFTDMTAGMTGTDEFIVLDSGSERRKAANEIGLSIFNNNAGFVTSSGVTSVGLTSQGDALQITNTPITSTGNLTINFQGDTGDYINGEGDLISFPSIPQGDITNVSTTSPITGGGSSGSVTIAHANSGVNAGQYSRATVTVNATGHVTSIFGNSDAQGVTSVATGNGISGGTITSTGTLTVGAGNGLSQSSTGLLMSGTYSGNYAITGNLSVDGQNIFGMGISTGTWYGDLSSNGYTRETGLNMTGGSEFVVVSKNGQGSVLVDGAYLAYESANGFFGSYNSAYGNLTGIQATDASTLTVKQLDGGTASLVVSSGNITLSGTGRIQGIDTVSASTDAANKAYVDASVPSVGNGTFTVSGSSGLSGSGSMTANQSGNSSASLTNTDKGSSQSIYKNFTASSGGTATANSNNDTLTIAAGTNITTVRSGDTITINATNDGQGVTSVATGSGLTGGTITSTGTISVDYGTSGLIADAPSGSGSPDDDDLILIGTDSSSGGETRSFNVQDLPFTNNAGDITNVSTTSPITGGGSSGSVTIAHANSGASAGSYTNANVTVNATGHVTSVSNGSDAQGVTSIATSTGLSGGTITSTGTLTNTDRGSQQNIYKNFTASSGGTATANSNNDTLTIAAGSNITTVRSGDTITINATNDGQGVTSVATSGSVSGLTLTGGTITSTGTITLGGTLSLTSANVTSALGFTPYSNSNPSGFTNVTNNNQLTNGAGYTTNTGTMTGFGVAAAVGGSSFTITQGETLSLVGGTNITASFNSSNESITFNNDITNNNQLTNGAGYVTSSGGSMSSWSLTADSGGSETITNGESVDIAGGTNITTARSGSTVTINNGISNNNQLTNGAGYTTNTGDITAVNAGIGMSGGGTSGSVTLSNAGVTSIVAGSNITISGSTGAVTINSSGGGGGGFTGGGAANKLAVWTSGTNIINTKITDSSGFYKFDNYTATATQTFTAVSGSAVNPNQNAQPASVDTLAHLAVDTSGNMVRGDQEITLTVNKDIINNGFGGGGLQVVSAPGSGKYTVVLDTTFLIVATSSFTSSGTVGFELRSPATNNNFATVSVFTTGQFTDISQNGSGEGIYNRDVPVTQRNYKENQAITLHKIGSGTLPSAFTSLKIKIRYRIYDTSTF